MRNPAIFSSSRRYFYYFKPSSTVLLAIAGIAAEVIGFGLILKSGRKLEFQEGDFVSGRYVDPKTGKPPPKIEGPPDPRMYRPGIYLVIAGLISQGLDIVATQIFNYQI